MRVNPTLVAAILTGVLLTGGCKSAPPTAPTTPAASPVRSDGTTAPSPAAAPGSSATAPGSASAPAPAPSAAQPMPAPAQAAAVQPAPPPPPPPPPPPVVLTAPSGAAVVVTVTEQLSASKNNVGDGFTGVLAQSLKTSSGAVVFPRGAHVLGTVVASKGQGRFKGSGALGIEVTSISGMRRNVELLREGAEG